MAARIQKLIAMLVISLTVAVISLPMTADAALPPVQVLAPVTQAVKSPVRLAMASDGGVYVADPRNSGVLRFSAAGKLVKGIKTAGVPQGVAVQANGNIIVTQGDFAAIYDTNSGAELARLSGATFGFADGVTVDDVGSIYVVDSKFCKVYKFAASGALDLTFGTNGNGTIGTSGTADGAFLLPTAIVFEKSDKYSVGGSIAVVDSAGLTGSSRIQFFSKSGVHMGSVGAFNVQNNTVGALRFTYPMGVAFEYSGTGLSRMYVVDTYNGTVQVIDMAGSPAYLGFVGEQGEDLSKGQLMLPTDVAFDATNKRLVVANGYGNVSLYGIDGGLSPTDNGGAAPALTIDNPNLIVSGTAASLSGTVTAGSSVYCTLGLVPFQASVNSTSWSCEVSGLAANASNQVDVKAVNASPYSTMKTAIVLSSSSASFTVNALPEIGAVSPITVSGTNPSGLTLCIKNGNENCQNTSATSWSVSVALAEGVNNIQVSASGPSWVGTTILDTSAPGVTVSMVDTTSAFAHDQVQNITGVLNEANPATVTVNGVTATLAGKVFSAPLVGATSFNIIATDLAGNSTTVSKTIKYDPSRAAIKVISHADGTVVPSSSQTITGTVSKPGTVTVNGSSAAVNGLEWSAPVNLVNGMNDIKIVAQDGSAAKLTLFVDTSKPAVAASLPSGDIATRDMSVSVGASTVAGASLESIVNGKSYAQASNVPFDVNLGAEGYYPITLVSTDSRGMASYSVRTIVRDTTPPAVTVPTPAGNVTTLAGTVEPGASVVVKNINTNDIVGTVSYANSTDWTATLGASTDPLTLLVQATDAAGNQITKFPFAATDGDINLVGGIADLTDARFCMDLVISHGPRVSAAADVTALQLAHGDIAPRINGVATPDGAIDILDCLLILRKAAGL